MTFSTNYRIVYLKDGLPEKTAKVLAKSEFGSYKITNGFHVILNRCTHWLKPVPDSILITREEAQAMWEAARDYQYNASFGSVPNPIPDFEQYISSLK